MQALVIDGVAHELHELDGYVLPGGVEHSAYCGPEGATVLDVFCPVREDYRGEVRGGGVEQEVRRTRYEGAGGSCRLHA